ncbi:hypothetical protein V1281_006651 [Nitrobacteraceae bacterium AZCC 2161]
MNFDEKKYQSNDRSGMTGDWAAIAEAVRAELFDNADATLEGIISELARGLVLRRNSSRPVRIEKTIKPQTVQRYIAALDFIERLEHLVGEEHIHDVENLRFAPVAAIAVLNRWADYDLSSAIRAALALVAGKHTVESLKRAEKLAGEEAPTLKSGRSLAHRLRHKVLLWGSDLLGSDYVLVTRSHRDPPADFLFRPRDILAPSVGVLVFGPYAKEAVYLAKQGEFLCLVVGLSHLLERVIAVVPEAPLRPDSYPYWLQKFRNSPANVEFYYFTGKLSSLELHKMSPLTR